MICPAVARRASRLFVLKPANSHKPTNSLMAISDTMHDQHNLGRKKGSSGLTRADTAVCQNGLSSTAPPFASASRPRGCALRRRRLARKASARRSSRAIFLIIGRRPEFLFVSLDILGSDDGLRYLVDFKKTRYPESSRQIHLLRPKPLWHGPAASRRGTSDGAWTVLLLP